MAHPNIILITADGLRPDCLGCAGNADVRTPNIDALAVHGVRFTNAVSPLPRFPAGAHTFLSGHTPNRFVPGDAVDVSPASLLALPAALRGAGYTTCAIGALELGPGPGLESFDRVYATGCAGVEDAYCAWLSSEGQALPESDAARGTTGLEPVRFPLVERYHPTTWTGYQAVRFCQTACEPFFLWISFPRPRPPLDPPMPWKQMYRPAHLRLMPEKSPPERKAESGPRIAASPSRSALAHYRRVLAAYYGCTSHVDQQIGRLLATLTGRGRTNNIFVVAAGFGTSLEQFVRVEDDVAPLPESLVRVPLIMGGILGQRKGAVDPALVSLGDIAPTLWDGIQLPPDGAPPGRSFRTQLCSGGVPHRPAVVLGGGGLVSGVMTTRYVWVVSGESQSETLFDLQDDQDALHNLSTEPRSLTIRKMLSGLARREAGYPD